MALKLVRGLTNMTIYSTFTESCLDCVHSPSLLKQNWGGNGTGSTQANSCFAFIYTATVLCFTYFMHSCGFQAFLLFKGLNLSLLLIILRLVSGLLQ